MHNKSLILEAIEDPDSLVKDLTIIFQALFLDPASLNLDFDFIRTEDGLSFYKFNIQPLSFPAATDDTGTIADYEALMVDAEKAKSGLGYYCEQIRVLHTGTQNSNNKTEIESCVKEHVEAMVTDASHTSGICSDGQCDGVLHGEDADTRLNRGRRVI